MNTTPEQLRIVADIMENGWEWEYSLDGGRWDRSIFTLNSHLRSLADGNPIQFRRKPLSFPPIPEGMSWHNPDGLPAEQVGDGYRLLVEGEKIPTTYEWYSQRDAKWNGQGVFAGETVPDKNGCCTCRVPIQTPFPDGSKIVDGKLVKPFVPKFKVGDRVTIIDAGSVYEVLLINHSEETYKLSNGLSYYGDTLKLAPLPEPPKLVPWDDTSDFPKVPTIWIRSKNDYRDHMVIGFAHPCAIITVTCGSGPVLQSIHLTQDGLRDMEWSEDRKDWLPCSKTA